ncbi:MAG TPA: hypothetical protein VGI03_00320 [Verrucomicrobiae bacterium]|jgi:hypothetical protein
MLKQTLLIIAIIISLFLGLVIGSHDLMLQHSLILNQANDPEASVTLINRKIADAVQVSEIIEYLYAGNTNDAEFLLNLQQSSDILAINDLLPTATENSRHTATNLFRMVSRSYVDRLSDYHGPLGYADSNSILKVQMILSQYKK